MNIPQYSARPDSPSFVSLEQVYFFDGLHFSKRKPMKNREILPFTSMMEGAKPFHEPRGERGPGEEEPATNRPLRSENCGGT